MKQHLKLFALLLVLLLSCTLLIGCDRAETPAESAPPDTTAAPQPGEKEENSSSNALLLPATKSVLLNAYMANLSELDENISFDVYDYGMYSNVQVVSMEPTGVLWAGLSGLEIVGNELFLYMESPSLTVFDGKNFYSLEVAYEKVLLSEADYKENKASQP